MRYVMVLALCTAACAIHVGHPTERIAAGDPPARSMFAPPPEHHAEPADTPPPAIAEPPAPPSDADVCRASYESRREKRMDLEARAACTPHGGTARYVGTVDTDTGVAGDEREDDIQITDPCRKAQRDLAVLKHDDEKCAPYDPDGQPIIDAKCAALRQKESRLESLQVSAMRDASLSVVRRQLAACPAPPPAGTN